MHTGKTSLALSLASLAAIALLGSCLSTTAKVIMPPPYLPAKPTAPAAADAPKVLERAKVYYSETAVPVIDGDFSEWRGLEGQYTRQVVFGSVHDPVDCEGFFVLRTDGRNLYVYARVTDDKVVATELPASLAWRSDSVEVYFGATTARHDRFDKSDNQMRMAPAALDDKFNVVYVCNDVEYPGDVKGAFVPFPAADGLPGGYEVEFAVPLRIMNIPALRPGQAVRCDFQVNDADRLERDRLLHWRAELDNPYFDPSVWGDGDVVALPAAEPRS